MHKNHSHICLHQQCTATITNNKYIYFAPKIHSSLSAMLHCLWRSNSTTYNSNQNSCCYLSVWYICSMKSIPQNHKWSNVRQHKIKKHGAT